MTEKQGFGTEELAELEAELTPLFAANRPKIDAATVQRLADFSARLPQPNMASASIAQTAGQAPTWVRWALAAVMLAAVGAGGWFATLGPKADEFGGGADAMTEVAAGDSLGSDFGGDDLEFASDDALFVDPTDLSDDSLLAAASLDFSELAADNVLLD